MNLFLQNILLAFVWTLLTGDVSFINFVEGMILGFIVLFIARNALGPNKYFKRIPKLILFILYFIKEIIKANIKIAIDVLTITHYMKPGIIAIPLDCETDIEITLFANLITLTPGTLSLDVLTDRKVLYIHAMYIDDIDETKQEIKNGLERKLLELTR